MKHNPGNMRQYILQFVELYKTNQAQREVVNKTNAVVGVYFYFQMEVVKNSQPCSHEENLQYG